MNLAICKGKTFRKEYGNLCEVWSTLLNADVMELTSTASHKTRKSICKILLSVLLLCLKSLNRTKYVLF